MIIFIINLHLSIYVFLLMEYYFYSNEIMCPRKSRTLGNEINIIHIINSDAVSIISVCQVCVIIAYSSYAYVNAFLCYILELPIAAKRFIYSYIKVFGMGLEECISMRTIRKGTY